MFGMNILQILYIQYKDFLFMLMKKKHNPASSNASANSDWFQAHRVFLTHIDTHTPTGYQYDFGFHHHEKRHLNYKLTFKRDAQLLCSDGTQSDMIVYRKKRLGRDWPRAVQIDAKDVHVSTWVRNLRVSWGFMKRGEKERDCREITERHRVSGDFSQSWAEHNHTGTLTDTLAASVYSYR